MSRKHGSSGPAHTGIASEAAQVNSGGGGDGGGGTGGGFSGGGEGGGDGGGDGETNVMVLVTFGSYVVMISMKGSESPCVTTTTTSQHSPSGVGTTVIVHCGFVQFN